ncbi:MAG: histidine phosphatase family protein [Mycobacterium leprae]
MNRLYLIRHARPAIDPARHHSEWQLDSAGQADLDRMAALPCFGSAYLVVSSSEPKAVKTAVAIIAAHPHLPLACTDDLKELHKGSFVGADHDAVMAQLFRFPGQAVAPGWETAAEALTRVDAAIRQLIGAAVGRDLIVVSHGTVLSLWLAQLRGQAQVDPAEWAAIGFPDFCVVDTGTMAVIQPFGGWRRA